jgi:hypothetical protein
MDRTCWLSLVLLAASGVAQAQATFEVTPLVGGRFGGTIGVREDPPQSPALGGRTDAHLDDGFSFGVAAGVRYDLGGILDYCEGCQVVEFRWMRDKTHLGLNDPSFAYLGPAALGLSKPPVTLDHFLGDFTHEWDMKAGSVSVRPFATVSLGAARMSMPASSKTRFAFGLGTGFKVLTRRHWGFRFHIEYLPVVMQAEIQRIVCSGGCVVAVSGGVMNQFRINAGPIFRF